MSSPIGFSFTDNVSKTSVEKIIMSSAKKFGQSLLKVGKGAIMTKFYMKKAYKIVPCNIEDLRLQGIKWCVRFLKFFHGGCKNVWGKNCCGEL